MKMSPEELDRYLANPLDSNWVYDRFNIPKDRYFTVSILHEPGFIIVDQHRQRDVKPEKISKSSQ